MERLRGKVAIVTGAGSGIGEATARLMAREGASVVVADIDRVAAKRVAGELTSAMAAEVDVSNEAHIVHMMELAIETFGGIDIVHNNATDSKTNATDIDIVTLDMELFDRLVAVNLKSVVMACKHGLMLTPAVKDVTPEQRAASNKRYPMPRLCEPNDVANAVLFLASDEAGFVNGTTLMVEGGATVYMPSIQFTGQGQ